MTRVSVTLDGGRGYEVVIAPGALNAAAAWLGRFARDGRLLCVTDAHVAAHWLAPLTRSLADAGIALTAHILPPGEGTKSWPKLEAVTDWLLDQEVERRDHIVALGGGVVGDLSGFAAAIVKRGCAFVQVPTTLLAQVDSSVGGKTAIDTRHGKNLVGAFHQPAHVLIDPDVLATLPPRELAAGWAELVKYGLIDDPEFFAWCEASRASFLAGDVMLRAEGIARAVTAKARIVGADERETTGQRALLNLGHTFGHALEMATGFGATLLHGEAVAAGMALAARYSVRRGHCPPADAARIAALLDASGLPTTLRAARVRCDGATLTAHMRHDKKRAGGNLPFILLDGIGRARLAQDVALADVAAFLDAEAAL